MPAILRLGPLAAILGAGALIAAAPVPVSARTHPQAAGRHATTPIRHVILIIGENLSFDGLYGTYRPSKGQTVWNLLSSGIVNADGTPGPHAALARQWEATDTTIYSPSPTHTRPFATLPALTTSGAVSSPPFATVADAARRETGLLPADAHLLLTGTTGQPQGAVDRRFPQDLPNAPVDVTRYVPFDSYIGNPVHRFFQMRQELDCAPAAMTALNPSGCRADLFPWVEVTVGAGSNGAPRPRDYTLRTTHEGAVSMAFYNMAAGDAPYFAGLAREYALADNYHQAALGGTGANHIMIGYGTLIYYQDGHGRPALPPAGQIENPDPAPGGNNWYIEDGYGDAGTGGGGSYVDCSDPRQPGVAPIDRYLHALPYGVFNNGDCVPGAYYLVNNYNPGYLGNGQPAPLGPREFTVPPTRQDNLALLLSRHQVSWKYYGEGWSGGAERGQPGEYCNICDPFLFSTQVMTDPALRANNQGLRDLYAAIGRDALPDVALVKPDSLLDGHPGSSKVDLLAGFVHKIVAMVQARPALWRDTAIMVIFDEGGGLYDEGYVQPIDFFGDGTRVPLIVVSRFSRGGRVVHTYDDHVSFDKFVEANWGIEERISPYSRDNLPNPIPSDASSYVPRNQPAIGNLMDMFDFGKTGTGR